MQQIVPTRRGAVTHVSLSPGWRPCVVLLVLLLGSNSLLRAQDRSADHGQPFLEIMRSTAMSPAERAAVQAGKAGKASDEDMYIRVAETTPAFDAERGYLVTIDGRKHYLRINYAEAGNDGQVSLLGTSETGGSFYALMDEQEGPRGHLTVGSDTYSFLPAARTLGRVQHSESTEGTTKGGTAAVRTTAEIMGCPSDAGAGGTVNPDYACAAVVDVLFVRTLEADQFLNGLTGDIQDWQQYVFMAQTQTNGHLARSAVGPKMINALRHDPLVSPLNIPGDTIICGDRGQTPLVDVLITTQELTTLRTQYDADALLFVDDHFDCAGQVAGLNVQYDDAFGVIDINKDMGYWARTIVPHELGHMFDAVHKEGVLLFGNPSFDRATVMGGIDYPGVHRIPHYSNPAVYYEHLDAQGNIIATEPTGAVGPPAFNNAARIATNFCRISQLELSGNTHALIDAGYYYPGCGQIQLNSVVIPGNTGGPASGPFTYEWRVSTTPNFTTSTYVSSNTNTSFSWPDLTPRYFWVSVTASDGTVVRAAIYRDRCETDDSGQSESKGIVGDREQAEDLTADNFKEVLVTVGGQSTKSFILPMSPSSTAVYDYMLVDGLGSIVAQGQLNERQKHIRVTETLHTGIYYLAATSKNGNLTVTTKIVVP